MVRRSALHNVRGCILPASTNGKAASALNRPICQFLPRIEVNAALVSIRFTMVTHSLQKQIYQCPCAAMSVEQHHTDAVAEEAALRPDRPR